jgi:hypothetical protein
LVIEALSRREFEFSAKELWFHASIVFMLNEFGNMISFQAQKDYLNEGDFHNLYIRIIGSGKWPSNRRGLERCWLRGDIEDLHF